VQKLVEARGRDLGAARTGAGIRVEQRLRDRFEKMRRALQEKHPSVDLSSPSFYEQIDERALAWWGSRAFSGPGVDW
jgi:hypothetical protein